jgi:mono/diheme cytochrome c family protein
MKNLFGLLFGALFLFVVFGFTFNQMPEDPAGKKLFVDKKCGSCHTVESEGLTSKNKKSVDLSLTGDKHNSETIAKFLAKKEAIDGKKHGAAFKGTDEELNDLSAWLVTLKAKK